MIPRPGLSTGLYTNTRRLASIVSGSVIAIGSVTVLGQRGIFLTCAAPTLIGLGIIAIASKSSPRASEPEHEEPPSCGRRAGGSRFAAVG